MSFLSNALSAIGYTSDEQRIKLIQLYYVSGALTDGIIPNEVLNDRDALTELSKRSFISPLEALNWFDQIGQDQRSRFRPQGTERQQMTEPKKLKIHNMLIVDILEKLGFLSSVIPLKYDIAALMLLGGGQGIVEIRFQFAAKLIIEGKINPKEIIIVSGARDLWPADTAGLMKGETNTLDILEQRIHSTGNVVPNIREILQAKFDSGFAHVNPKDGSQVVKARADIAKLISKEYDVKWPTEADMMKYRADKHPVLNKFKTAVVNAPKISVKHGQEFILERPNTKSTLEETIRQCGEELMYKDVVFISSQPHCKYQQGVIEEITGQLFNVYMAAPGINLKDTLPDQVVMRGLEAVYSSIYSYKGRATELLKEQEEQDYSTRWQDYIRERCSLELKSR